MGVLSECPVRLQPREVVANLSYRQDLISLGCIAICLLGSITWPGSGWIWATAVLLVVWASHAASVWTGSAGHLASTPTTWVSLATAGLAWALAFGYGGLKVASFDLRWAAVSGVAGACVAYLGLVGVRVLVSAARWMHRRRNRSGCCATCGYDLRGLPERRCPECGRPF